MSANLPAVTMGVGKHPRLTPDAVVTVLLLVPAPDPENSGTDPAIAAAGGIPAGDGLLVAIDPVRGGYIVISVYALMHAAAVYCMYMIICALYSMRRMQWRLCAGDGV